MTDPRIKLWHNILDDLGPPEGCMMPRWLIAVRLAIFPIDTAYALIQNRCEPHDIWTKTWKIYGEQYSDAFFRCIAIADGDLYRIERVDGRITFTRYDSDLMP